MKKTIWKYELGVGDTTLQIPEGAEILTVQTQFEEPVLWALVEPENPKTPRYFEAFGTGLNVPGDMGVERKYIGSAQLENGGFVLHYFERLN